MRKTFLVSFSVAFCGFTSFLTAQTLQVEEQVVEEQAVEEVEETITQQARTPLFLEDIRVNLGSDVTFVRTQSWANMTDDSNLNATQGSFSVVLDLSNGAYGGFEMRGFSQSSAIFGGDELSYKVKTYALRGGFRQNIIPWVQAYATGSLGVAEHELDVTFNSTEGLSDQLLGISTSASLGVRGFYQFPVAELGIALDYGYFFTTPAHFDEVRFDDDSTSEQVDMGTLHFNGQQARVLFSVAFALQTQEPAIFEPQTIIGPSTRAVSPIGVPPPPARENIPVNTPIQTPQNPEFPNQPQR